MNDQQRMSRRAYDDAAKLRNQTIADTNRIIKTQRDREASLRKSRSRGSNTTSGGATSGSAAKSILVFLVVGIVLFALFALFVLIVSGLKSSPFG